MNEKEPYDHYSFTMGKFKEIFDALYKNREPDRPIVIHTGLGGMMTFDYCLADQSGLLSSHMKKQHGKFTRLLGTGLHKAVDENGIVWMIGRVKGKGYYFSNMEQKTSPARHTSTRFRIWNWSLELGEEPPRKPFTTYGYDEAIQRYREKKEAKIAGIRRKGTWTPEQGAMYRGE